MRRTTKVLFLSLIAALALGLGGCFGEDTVSEQEIQKAERTFKTMMLSVEKACVAAEKDSSSVPALRRAYVVSRSRFVNARDATYEAGYRDKAEGLPSVHEASTLSLEEVSQAICPGTFKVPPPPKEAEEE